MDITWHVSHFSLLKSFVNNKTYRPSSKSTASTFYRQLWTRFRSSLDRDILSFWRLIRRLLITGYVHYLMWGRKASLMESTRPFSAIRALLARILRPIKLPASFPCLKPASTRWRTQALQESHFLEVLMSISTWISHLTPRNSYSPSTGRLSNHLQYPFYYRS